MRIKIGVIEMDHKMIEQLFYQQIKRLTLGESKSFDFQFSDRWLR